MKKNNGIKLWGLLISLLAFLLIPMNIYAEGNYKVVVSGDSTVAAGAKNVKYIVTFTPDTANADKHWTKFTADVSYSSSILKFESVEVGNGWSGIKNGNGIELSVPKDTAATGNIVATLVFSVLDSPKTKTDTITLKNAMVSYSNEEEGDTSLSISNITGHSIRLRETDNTLKNLKVNGTAVDGFKSNTFEYNIDVESSVSTAKIVATVNESHAKLKSGSGNRTVNLDYGSNTIKVIVVSESGKEQTYTLNITREDTRSTDATLSSITVDGEPIENFSSTTYKYALKKYKLTTLAKVDAKTTDEKAKFVVTPPKSLVVGENTYTITVTSEKGDTAIYTVVVNNVENAINKKLKTLSVKGYDINFDRNNNRYEIRYNKSKFKKLHIYYTTMGASDEVVATLSPDINNDEEALKDLTVGDEITITVTGIDGEKVEYTIVVVKDNRISFFLVLEIFLIIVIAGVIIVLVIKRKKDNEQKSKRKPSNYKTTKVEKKDEKKEEKSEELEEEREITTPRRRSRSAVEIVENDRPKRRRFSIYEDEYEEVEVEVDDEDEDNDLSSTKEFRR